MRIIAMGMYGISDKPLRCNNALEDKRIMNKQDILDARCDIEWVEEYINCAGEKHKQVYIDALERVRSLLEKIQKAAEVLED